MGCHLSRTIDNMTKVKSFFREGSEREMPFAFIGSLSGVKVLLLKKIGDVSFVVEL